MRQEDFDKLLAFLDSDLGLAASKYEMVRKKLIVFFQCRGCSDPEGYADITINRVAKRIGEGVDIHAANPLSFFYGVARKILQESWNDSGRKSVSLDDPSIFTNISQDPAEIDRQEAQRVQLEHSCSFSLILRAFIRNALMGMPSFSAIFFLFFIFTLVSP